MNTGGGAGGGSSANLQALCGSQIQRRYDIMEMRANIRRLDSAQVQFCVGFSFLGFSLHIIPGQNPAPWT